MSELCILTVAEQVAAHLRVLILKEHWTGTMPGVHRIGTELGVNPKTVEVALRQLERENILIGQGPRRQRLIAAPRAKDTLSSLRVGILLHDRIPDLNVDYICALQHSLREAGHRVVIPKKSLIELKMDVKRVKKIVEQTAADAWIVYAGSSDILEWFSARSTPSFALFGRHFDLPMAGIAFDMIPAFITVTNQLIELGHRRIVLLARKQQRLPEPGVCARLFLKELESHGIPTGTYNLPDWKEDKDGLHDILTELFRVTPPTALILDEPLFCAATLLFLNEHRIKVPDHISLICLNSDYTFTWCSPSIAHIRTDTRPITRDITRWLEAVSKGQNYVRQTIYPTEFISGGTIGPTQKP